MTAVDMVLAGGVLVDGSGAPGRPGDLAIAGDRIAGVGSAGAFDGAPAGRRLDVAGRIVAPGFVDLHAHSDLTILRDGRARSKVLQGVTTEVNGNCGIGPVPAPPGLIDDVRRLSGLIDPDPLPTWPWQDLVGYRNAVMASDPALNVAPLIGHLPLRVAVAGERAGPLIAAETAAMVDLLEAALDAGAFGVSTGLMYPPAMSATLDELVALGEAVARRGRLFAIHMRNYADRLLSAVGEAIEIARRSGCRLQISHLAVAGRRNWGAVSQALELLDAARADGLDVAHDIYPYLAGSANLSQLLPEWAQAGGASAMLKRLARDPDRRRIRAEWQDDLVFGWDEIEVALVDPGLEDLLGLSVAQVGAAWGLHPDEAALELVRRTEDRVTMVAYGRSPGDLEAALRHPACSVGSDGLAMDPDGPTAAGRPHPRSFGCYPRLLGRFVRDEGVLDMETAITMCTARPASRAGLRDRGRLETGWAADVVVFDPDTVIDRATFRDPRQLPRGIEHVIVNGVLAVEDGRQIDDRRAGRVLAA